MLLLLVSCPKDGDHLIQVTGGQDNRIKEILPLFEGTKRELYRRLGKLNDASRRRILLASDMTNEQGWRPLLVNLLGSEYGTPGTIGDYIISRGLVVAPGFNGLKLPSQAISLLGEYNSIRSKLLNVIRDNLDSLDKTIEHPTYATHPIFVIDNSEHIEELLINYLRIYSTIIDYVEQEQDLLEWSQLFVLLYLDCVIHWDNTDLRNSIFLIGPWHPLVLAKRYMVQSSIVFRAQRLGEKNGKVFRKLTVLLKEINGFRWILGLGRNNKLLEALHVSPSSDPAWHIGIKQDLGVQASRVNSGSLEGILEQLREKLGLQTSILEGYPEDIVYSGVSSFMRAFPSRRSLGIRIKQGYSNTDVVSSLDRLLHGDEAPTDVGQQLPGGIRLLCKDSLNRVEDIKWSNPPILLHEYKDDEQCFREMMPDIHLLAPTRDISFDFANNRFDLPRGSGIQSVFNEPLSWLTEGQSQLPNSVSQEFDSLPLNQDGLGEAFVGATSQICQILQNKIVTVRAVDLPNRLHSPWAIAPGSGLDPAIFVKYVRDGASRSIQDRALWDYRVDIEKSKNSFYILSTIPRGFAVAINGFFGTDNVAGKFIEELGSLGIAIGGEALKSGRHALGVVGLVGAIRLLLGIGGNGKGAFRQGQNCVGFLIPVDSFASFFGKQEVSKIEDDVHSKRTDLLAIQLLLPTNGNDNLSIYACGIESKFVSRSFSQTRAIDALNQAKETVEQFQSLVQTSLQHGAIPERLGLLALLRFGLRISSPSKQEDMQAWIKTEQSVFHAILQGKYESRQSEHNAIVISTEGQFPGTPESNFLPGGMWIRINKGHWPEISDSPQLDEIREKISCIFGISMHNTEKKEDKKEKPTPFDFKPTPPIIIATPSIPEERKESIPEEKDDGAIVKSGV